ncbi:Sister chromatid cohesion protein 2 [Vanrija albida]|uniref:Sister chromatid cohesion protein 2 n=1 Tax=Vanrija albida TaxID=181172 RepID=A0ABR3PSC9_9TREE
MAHQLPPNGGHLHWASGGGGSGTGTGTDQQSSLPPNVPSPYDDPATILRVYPLINYTPTARVAGHFAPHTVAYQPPASSSSLYPQYQAGFQRLDSLQTAEDLLARNDVLQRIAPMIQGSSYGNQPYTIQPPTQHAFPPQNAFPLATNGHSNPPLPPAPVPDFVNHRMMAYDFFPSTPTSSSSVQPPTPSSVAGSSPAPSARGDPEFFEQFIDRSYIDGTNGLRLNSPAPYTGPHTAPTSQSGWSKPSSVNVTPTHSRTGIKPETDESPDPLSLTGPSPSKKHKSSTDLRASPSPSKSRPSSVVVLIPTKRADLVDNDPSLRTLSDRARSTGSLHSTPALDNHESDEDDINWGDSRKVDTDGDYHMSHGAVDNQAQYLPTGGRTGERDQRSSYQKLQNLLEDIFEEQDSFAAEPSPEDVSNSRFFSGVSSDGAHALLSVDALNKVARYVSRLQHSKKRQRTKSDSGGIPWDAESILRILKMMEKIMREAEYANPFPDSGRHATGTSASPQKKKKGAKKAADEGGQEGTPEVDEADMLELENILAGMSTAASAALCCLVIMATDGLPKQLFSEDLLSLAVLTVRHSMDSVIFKVVEGLASESVNSNRLALVVNAEASAAANGRSRKADPLFKNGNISSIAQATCAAVPHIAGLLDRPDMSLSEELFTSTVYMAIGPVFVREPATRRGKKDGGNGPAWSVMKSLRTESLGCLRGAFAHYEDQRLWIIDMILQSLSKVQEQGSAQPHFQLSNGNSIHTLSALLLQLVQASSYGVGSRIRRLRRSAEASSEIPDPEKAQQGEIQILGEAFDAALRSTKTIAGHLVQKAGASKGNKSSSDTDFKAILDTFVADLLTVVYRPEWPAAPLFLNILSKIFIGALDNQRSTHEASAARAVAMDYLGDIAARLRALHQQIESKTKVPSLDEIIADANIDGMVALAKAQTTIQSFLSTASREDSMFVSSGEMSQMLWAQELDSAQRKIVSVLEKVVTEVVDEDEDAEAPGSQNASVNRDNLQIIAREIGLAIRKVWNPEDQLFEISDPHQADEALQASLAISRTRPLQGAFEPLLRGLSIAMNSTVVGLRSKAIRGLGSVVVADPDLLSQDSVRNALELGLSDSSPQVRDAAVDLVGKYVVQRSNLAVEYYPLIAERITDTGLGVRKRVIRLLRGIFEATEDHDTRIEICYQLLRAGAEDEDEGVQELAIKSLSDIIYPNTKFVAEETAGLLVDILGKFRSNESLESALQAVSCQCSPRLTWTDLSSVHQEWA